MDFSLKNQLFSTKKLYILYIGLIINNELCTSFITFVGQGQALAENQSKYRQEQAPALQNEYSLSNIMRYAYRQSLSQLTLTAPFTQGSLKSMPHKRAISESPLQICNGVEE